MTVTNKIKAGAIAVLGIAALIGAGVGTTPATAAVPRAAGFMPIPSAKINDWGDGPNFTLVIGGHDRDDHDWRWHRDHDRYNDNWYRYSGDYYHRDWRDGDRDRRRDDRRDDRDWRRDDRSGDHGDR